MEDNNITSYLDLPEKCGDCPCRLFSPIKQFMCQLMDKSLGRPYADDRPEWCPLRKVTPDGWQTGIPTEGRLFMVENEGETYGVLIVDVSRPQYEERFKNVVKWELLD